MRNGSLADGVGVRLGGLPRALAKALQIADYPALRREQAEKWGQVGQRELMGIGLSFFTETVGAGPRKHMDVLRPGHG